ncbi:hypothetical protein OOT46_08080 [Aquabacterium sp. A7-Y]|uniref:hypothetical protein n=1 Tax=Aquabacterium sp. A7-Y TaxID=1349605 RepID=UPI00223E6598|nr:hypothetical protein [Aquabacterium sp. A7-Y]MCW7537807.1 hypothetical protein [Aquabacterium sp. A7-Y]
MSLMSSSPLPSARGPQALLVACESEEALYLRSRLSLYRVAVHEAWTATQAVEHCAEHLVHVAFVDAEVVGAPLLALCQQLRRKHPCRPAPQLVLLGGAGQRRALGLRGVLAGGAWLAKPLHPRELDRQILRRIGLGHLAPEERPTSLFT